MTDLTLLQEEENKELEDEMVELEETYRDGVLIKRKANGIELPIVERKPIQFKKIAKPDMSENNGMKEWWNKEMQPLTFIKMK